jgi:hypothetical protein
MIFLHPWFLIGGTAVAVPIVIHLLNRRSAKIIDWGAMHFLLGSMVNRKRRVLLDDILLLACRCLLIALVAAAIARPVIPAGSSIAWAVVLPILLLGAVALGVGTAVWQHRQWRWICYGIGAGLLGLAFLAIVMERWLHLSALVGQARDVVLVIDGSSSMNLQVEGRSNFVQAVEEGRDLLKSLKGDATVSVILAGPLPQVKTLFPLTNPEQLTAILDDLKPLGGPMSIHDALRTASLTLSLGSNTRKQIVLITDGHKVGWEVDDRDRWQATAGEIRACRGGEPQLFCRLLGMPAKVRNVAVTEVSFPRRIVGTDRPAPINARVANTGNFPVGAFPAYLVVDGKQVDKRAVGQLDPGSAEVLGFSYRFESPGSHVVEVQADVEDQLPDDNRQTRVLHVTDHLPVLIVNGQPAGRLLDRASGFLQLALDPGGVAPAAPGDAGKPGARGLVEVAVTDVGPGRLEAVGDWSRYRVVVLADVATLPGDVAAKLGNYVVNGGGLLIAPGAQSSPAFYNGWMATVGDQPQRLLPVSLVKRVPTPHGLPLQLAVRSLTHPAFESLRESPKSDLDKSQINGRWKLETAPGCRQVLIAGKLTDDSPWLAEQSVGQGKVMVTATALDAADSNLPTRQAFVPLVHGMVYHLADDGQWDLNRSPARQLLLRFPASVAQAGPVAKGAAALAPGAVLRCEVTAPDGSRLAAAGRIEQGSLVVQVDDVAMPGLHRLQLPAAAGAGATAPAPIPFSVAGDPAESTMEQLSPRDLQVLTESVGLQPLLHREDIEAISAGRAHGTELWKSLMFMTFIVVLAEVALTWWVGLQRIPPELETFDFAGRATTADFRKQLEQVRAGGE